MSNSNQFNIFDGFTVNNIIAKDYSLRHTGSIAELKAELESITNDIETNGVDATTKLLAQLITSNNTSSSRELEAVEDLKRIVRVCYTDGRIRYILKTLNNQGGIDILIYDRESAKAYFDFLPPLLGLPKLKVGGVMREITMWKLMEKYARQFMIYRFDFNPPSDDHDCFRLFSGFKYQVIENYDIALIQNHLNHWKNTLCSGQEDQYDYFIKWNANVFQHPDTPSMTALTLISKQGAGKSRYYTDHFLELLGKAYGCVESDVMNIFGHFNVKLGNKVGVVIDEATDANQSTHYKISYDKLKSTLTGKYISITPKGKDTYDIKNVIHLIFATNNYLPCKIEDNDRRLVFMDVSNKYCAISDDIERTPEILEKERARNEYFDALEEETKNPLFYPTMMSYFMSIDLNGWHPERSRPQTEQKKIILERSEDPLKLFIKENIEQFIGNEPITQQSTSDLYQQYKNYCAMNGHKFVSSMPTFMADLKEKYDIEKKRVMNNAKTIFVMTPAGRVRWKATIDEHLQGEELNDTTITNKLLDYVEYIPEEKQNEYLELIGYNG